MVGMFRPSAHTEKSFPSSLLYHLSSEFGRGSNSNDPSLAEVYRFLVTYIAYGVLENASTAKLWPTTEP